MTINIPLPPTIANNCINILAINYTLDNSNYFFSSRFSPIRVKKLVNSSSSSIVRYDGGPDLARMGTFPNTLSERVDFGTLNNSAARRTDVPCLTAFTAYRFHSSFCIFLEENSTPCRFAMVSNGNL